MIPHEGITWISSHPVRHFAFSSPSGANEIEPPPIWTDQFMATGAGIYASGVMTPKLIELLSIAFDASYTHMYAPGTRRHIKAALEVGATMEEVMDVFKLCVVQGVQACNLGVPILKEEIANLSGGDKSKR